MKLSFVLRFLYNFTAIEIVIIFWLNAHNQSLLN
jgi:hypothetical protein